MTPQTLVTSETRAEHPRLIYDKNTPTTRRQTDGRMVSEREAQTRKEARKTSGKLSLSYAFSVRTDARWSQCSWLPDK